MKKLLILIACMASTSAVAYQDTYKKYRVSDQNDSSIFSDLRVFEFTPKTRPDYICVYVSGGNDGGLSCFPKEDTSRQIKRDHEEN